MKKSLDLQSKLLEIDDIFFKDYPFIFSKINIFNFQEYSFSINISSQLESLIVKLWNEYSSEIKKMRNEDIIERPYLLCNFLNNGLPYKLRKTLVLSILVFTNKDFDKKISLSKERVNRTILGNNISKEIILEMFLLNPKRMYSFYGFEFIKNILKNKFISETNNNLFHEIKKYDGDYLIKNLYLEKGIPFDDSFLKKKKDSFIFKDEKYNKELKLNYSWNDLWRDFINLKGLYNLVTPEEIWDFYKKSPLCKLKLINVSMLIDKLETKNQISFVNDTKDKRKIILPIRTKEEKMEIGKMIENDIKVFKETNDIFSFETFINKIAKDKFIRGDHLLSKYYDIHNLNCTNNLSTILYSDGIRNYSYKTDNTSLEYPIVFDNKYNDLFKHSYDIALEILKQNFRKEKSFFITDVFEKKENIKKLGFTMNWWTQNILSLHKNKFLTMKKQNGKELYSFT